jgi:hypothetical protein
VLKGNLLSFAGYKKHIGIYPTPAGDEKFRDEIAACTSHCDPNTCGG